MRQYIDKYAIKAEIEKRRSKNSKNKLNIVAAFEDNYLLSFLDDLEVKEVDLKQSYREYINNTYNEEFAKSILDGNIKGDLDNSDLFGIMCYGFELGMTVSNKA